MNQDCQIRFVAILVPLGGEVEFNLQELNSKKFSGNLGSWFQGRG